MNKLKKEIDSGKTVETFRLPLVVILNHQNHFDHARIVHHQGFYPQRYRLFASKFLIFDYLLIKNILLTFWYIKLKSSTDLLEFFAHSFFHVL